MTPPRINPLLKRVGRSLLWTEVAELSCKAFLIVLAMGLVGIIFDAVFALHRVGLVVLDGALLAATAWAVWPILIRLRRGRAKASETALMIEDRLGIADNRLVNALDLAGRDSANTSASLRHEAIARGEAIAGAIDPGGMIDRDALRRAIKPSAAAVVVWMLAYLVMPGVFHAVVPRVFAPLADYPPYTSVRFDIQIDPEPIYVDEPATIHVVLTGPSLPRRAGVVFVDNGIGSPPLPMDRISAPRNETPGKPTSQAEAVRFRFQVARVSESQRFYILTPRGRSGLHRLEVDRSPRIREADVTLRYPGYTGWPNGVEALTPDGISALAGTDVTLRITSNVALVGGALRMVTNQTDGTTPDQTIPLTPDPIDPRIAEATFKLNFTGRFELSLIGADGIPGVEMLKGNLRALPDRVPKIEIVQPDRQVLVPEGWTVNVQTIAGDDIGIGRVTMRYRINGKPTTETPLTLTYADDDKTVAHTAWGLDLHALGAGAGDVVRYFVEAQDNRPSEAQSSKTPNYLIHVVSMPRYLDLARSRYGAEGPASAVDALNREDTSAKRMEMNQRAQRFDDFKKPFTAETMAGLDGPMPDTRSGGEKRLSDELARLPMVGPTVPDASGIPDAPGTPGSPGSPDSQGHNGTARAEHEARTGRKAVDDAERGGSGSVEVIQTDPANPIGRGISVTPGVPIEYREQAEAYFKRIAEESR